MFRWTAGFKAVPWLRRFVSGLSVPRTLFDSALVRVPFVLIKQLWDKFSTSTLVSLCHHHSTKCSILIIILTLLSSEGREVEAYEPSVPLCYLGGTGNESNFTLYFSGSE